MATEQKVRPWDIEQHADGWTFSYICHESEYAYPTREAALEALADFVADAHAEALTEADDDD